MSEIKEVKNEKEVKEVKKTVTKESVSDKLASKKTVSDKSNKTEPNSKKMVAVVRIRGNINVNSKILSTLRMLNLNKKNSCVVFVPTDSAMGMLRKSKDYITWGELSEETLTKLTGARTAKGKTFHLNPPKKGFGRKGIKVPFTMGGALGYRGEKINDLIERML